MSNYIMHNGQLYTTDELKHWKYVKKTRVNGKWRYYYDDSEYQQAAKAYEKAKNDYRDATSKKVASEVNYITNRNLYAEDGKLSERETRNIVEYKTLADYYDSKYMESGKTFIKAEKTFKKASRFYKTRSATSKAIVKAQNWISDLFSGKKKKKKATKQSKPTITVSSNIIGYK